MKSLKRAFLAIIILTTVGFLFRGWVYRQIVTYKSVGQRSAYEATNDNLIKYIEVNAGGKKDMDIENVINAGLSATSGQLHFSASQKSKDPNQLINSKAAHCVGYASFFATTCNYLLKKYKLSDQWVAKPQIGQLYLLGANIHTYFDSSFLRDHDFVTIENKTTGEILAVDPTVNDYLRIGFVTFVR